MIVLLDNRDSFVYNLVDALHSRDFTVFRNSVPAAEILATDPELIILSPGPCHPRDAGSMMELVRAARGRIPLLGICLGFQAMLEDSGGDVIPCGPVHGQTDLMRLTEEGARSPLFEGLTTESGGVEIARYHSLGCTTVPNAMVPLAWSDSRIGPVLMAGADRDGLAIGLQFHPESVLSPTGPMILDRSINLLTQRSLEKDPR